MATRGAKQTSRKGKQTTIPASAVRAKSKADLVESAIQSIESKLKSNEVKATIGDFIRLLQLQKELQVDQPREITVTWIDPSETEAASEE